MQRERERERKKKKKEKKKEWMRMDHRRDAEGWDEKSLSSFPSSIRDMQTNDDH